MHMLTPFLPRSVRRRIRGMAAAVTVLRSRLGGGGPRTTAIVGSLIALLVLVLTMPSSADAQPSTPRRRASSGAPGITAASAVRHISFSGHDWLVKNSVDTRIGPGPNYFSDSPKNVWVDTSGRLHLRIEKRTGRWYSAEVVSAASFGHGTYRWYLDSSVDGLDPNVVLGLFTWNDDPANNHRELDIEFARWGNAAYADGQYTVQPYIVAGNQYIFDEPSNLPQTTHSLVWAPASGGTPASATFKSVRGHVPASTDPSLRIAEYMFTQGVPPAGGENARMNLWLFEGSAPQDRRDVEIVIKRFEFVPPSTP
jgi:hypothetical protein